MSFGSICLTLLLSVAVLSAHVPVRAGELPGKTLDALHTAAAEAPAADKICRKKRHKTNTKAKC